MSDRMNDRMNDQTSLDDAAGLARVTDTLRRLPVTDPRAIDRVMVATLGRQRMRQQRRTWLVRAAGIVLAVGLAGGGMWVGRLGRPAAGTPSIATTADTMAPASDAPALAPTSTGSARFAAAGTGNATSEEAPVAITFALNRPNARRVSLVGDFNAWSPTAVPMTRANDGTWTTSTTLAPGRHAYAFVVDDTLWVSDPRAPLVRDTDYGRDHSIIVVGQP